LAAAIHIAKPEVSIKEGIAIAAETIDSGKAKTQLERFIEMSR
jgi:anthranilate phosphoribosyltransferase